MLQSVNFLKSNTDEDKAPVATLNSDIYALL